MSKNEKAVDVLAVLDRAAQEYAGLRDDCDGNNDKETGDGYERLRAEMREARAAVAELIAAARDLRRTKPSYSIEYGKAEARLAAALARIGGAP